MRSVAPVSSCRAALSALVLALLAGCGGTVPNKADTPNPSGVSRASGSWGQTSVPTPAVQAANPWLSLEAQVGRYPRDGGDFLRSGPLAERLRGLLGPTNYPVLLENMGVSGPLKQEGAMLYITGNRPHRGGTEAAAVVIHPAQDAVRVWLLTGGEEWDVQDQGAPKTVPAEVANVMDNARR